MEVLTNPAIKSFANICLSNPHVVHLSLTVLYVNYISIKQGNVTNKKSSFVLKEKDRKIQSEKRGFLKTESNKKQTSTRKSTCHLRSSALRDIQGPGQARPQHLTSTV